MENINDKLDKFIKEFYPTREFEVHELISKIEDVLSNLKGRVRKGEQYLDGIPKFRLPCGCSDFGYFNEDYLTKYFVWLVHTGQEKFRIKPFINGQMNFPDIILDDIIFDFKAVKCNIGKKGQICAPNYNNAIHACSNVRKEFMDYFNEGKVSDLIKSFAIYTYYIINENDEQQIVDFKIIPMICCIKTNTDFSIKSKNDEETKNANVCIGYNGINEKETYEECIERLKRVTFIS